MASDHQDHLTLMAETGLWTIHEAASLGDVEALRRELAAGISPNERTPFRQNDGGGGETPLHLCFSPYGHRNPECWRVLIAAGADVNARDARGHMPIHYVACHPITQLGQFDWRESKHALEFLLGAGAEVNAGDFNARTPLHLAAWAGFADAIEPLIRAGALANERDATNLTSLDWAIARRLPYPRLTRMYPLLLRAGADLPAQTDDPYLRAVIDAGGFARYAQSHLATIAALFARTERLPPEMVRHVVSFWLHAGYYVY